MTSIEDPDGTDVVSGAGSQPDAQPFVVVDDFSGVDLKGSEDESALRCCHPTLPAACADLHDGVPACGNVRQGRRVARVDVDGVSGSQIVVVIVPVKVTAHVQATVGQTKRPQEFGLGGGGKGGVKAGGSLEECEALVRLDERVEGAFYDPDAQGRSEQRGDPHLMPVGGGGKEVRQGVDRGGARLAVSRREGRRGVMRRVSNRLKGAAVD